MQIHRGDFTPDASTEFVFKRNCSISPVALWMTFSSLVAVSFGFGIAFAMHGPWMILPFAGLEMLALGTAFLVCGRHASDFERVVVGAHEVKVEVLEGRVRSVWEFNPRWLRLAVESAPTRVWLKYKGEALEVGRLAAGPAKSVFARDLRHALAQATRH